MGLPGDIPNQSHHCLVCIRLYQWIYDDAVGISIIDGYKIFAWWNAWSVFFCSTRVNEFIASMERMHVSQRSLFLFLLCFAFYDSKGGGRRDQRCYENEN